MKTYLGDAVYADIGAYGITLTTEDGISATNTIYLEPEVIASLLKFLEKLGYIGKGKAESATEYNTERDKLRIALRQIVQWSDACWTGGYAGDPKTPHPAWDDVQEGRKLIK